jgi:hypothetical protein
MRTCVRFSEQVNALRQWGLTYLRDLHAYRTWMRATGRCHAAHALRTHGRYMRYMLSIHMYAWGAATYMQRGPPHTCSIRAIQNRICSRGLLSDTYVPHTCGRAAVHAFMRTDDFYTYFRGCGNVRRSMATCAGPSCDTVGQSMSHGTTYVRTYARTDDTMQFSHDPYART